MISSAPSVHLPDHIVEIMAIMFLPVRPPFSVYRGHTQLGNSFCVCVCPDGAWSEEQAQATVSSFWTRAPQITPALCPERHGALPVHAARPRRPRGSCEDEHKIISTRISTVLLLPAQQLEITPVTAHMPSSAQMAGFHLYLICC